MHSRRALLVLSLFCIAATARGASPREALVVDSAWLKAHLNDHNLVLLHVGDKAKYEEAHIPGARLVSLQDISVSDRSEKGLVLEMPPADDLRQRLEALGISNGSRVIVYYGQDWISPSTRVIFTLDYAGLGDRASLLDGGLEAWQAAGGAVTKEVPAAAHGTLSPLKIQPIVVDAAFVHDHLGAKGFAVVDARASSFYDGIDTGGSKEQKQRTGHIRSAISIPYSSVANDRLFLLSPAELTALFSKAGVQPKDTVIGYCHVGQQATAMLFAARTLGHKVLLYDGSFQDWSRRTEYPVDNPAEKRAP